MSVPIGTIVCGMKTSRWSGVISNSTNSHSTNVTPMNSPPPIVGMPCLT
jgi:hypothetical protein